MKIIGDKTYLSASDLSTHIACPHATFLNLQEAKGLLNAPKNSNAILYVLQQKGEEFENSYIEQLRKNEKNVVEIDKTDKRKALQDTFAGNMGAKSSGDLPTER